MKNKSFLRWSINIFLSIVLYLNGEITAYNMWTTCSSIVNYYRLTRTNFISQVCVLLCRITYHITLITSLYPSYRVDKILYQCNAFFSLHQTARNLPAFLEWLTINQKITIFPYKMYPWTSLCYFPYSLVCLFFKIIHVI